MRSCTLNVFAVAAGRSTSLALGSSEIDVSVLSEVGCPRCNVINGEAPSKMVCDFRHREIDRQQGDHHGSNESCAPYI